MQAVKDLLFAVLFILLPLISVSQNFEWAVNVGSADNWTLGFECCY